MAKRAGRHRPVAQQQPSVKTKINQRSSSALWFIFGLGFVAGAIAGGLIFYGAFLWRALA